MRPRAITLFTHQHPEQTRDALARVLDRAADEQIEVRLAPEEAEKHGLEGRPGVTVDSNARDDCDMAIVLGGDGTILTALRAFAGRRAPVFAVNYGAIGFLSTVEDRDLDEGLARAFEGRYELLEMPALAIDLPDGQRLGVNDISFHRQSNGRVAELVYSVAGEQLGEVRCDGLVAATPVGSTGYNLANGGPVLAWGVEGFVVSFIAPHTLTARALVVAPDDPLTVLNLSERDAVEISTDGRKVGRLDPREEIEVRFRDNQVLLAQLPGSSFYHRLREKFGRLAY